MLQYCWVLPLSNEPKHIYVDSAVTEPIDFFVPNSRVLRYRALQPSSVRREGYTNRNLPPWDLEWYWTKVCGCGQTCFLCILHVKNVEGILLDNLVKKKQYLHYTITPPPTLARVCTALLQFNYRHLRLHTQIL